jgi:4a-hydroxytetrahydrobiopterin dehydratase
MSVSFAAQLRLEQPHFKAGWLEVSWARCGLGDRAVNAPEGWTLETGGKALLKTVKFTDFSEAFAFLVRVALHAEKVDHHQEFTNVWNRIDFRLTTHDAGEVTDRDVELARAINRLLDAVSKQ